MKKKLLIISTFLAVAVIFYISLKKDLFGPYLAINNPGSSLFRSASFNLSFHSGYLKRQVKNAGYSFSNDPLGKSRYNDQAFPLDSSILFWESSAKANFSQRINSDWLQFTGELYEQTGDSKYIDELEIIAYNHGLGSLNIDEESAANLNYISPYFSGVFSQRLVINFYEPGTYTAYLPIQGKNKKVKYDLESNYPLDGTVELSIFPRRAKDFTISLRVPAWCNNYEVHVKGEAFQGQAGSYLDLFGNWSAGDVVRICMDLNIEPRRNENNWYLARGPQILCAPAELQNQINFPANWKGKQRYNLFTIKGQENSLINLVPYADACRLDKSPEIYKDSLVMIEEDTSTALAELRDQLAAFRHEFGGANDLPEVNFFLFGMGNRTKLLYRDGILKNVISGDTLQSWSIVQQTIIPNEYRVELRLLNGTSVSIFENEAGVFLQEGTLSPNLVTGTGTSLKLPDFQDHRYNQVLKVLHHEILINIVNSQPLPNFLAYNKPWRRDAAMMAMCLEKTGNLGHIKEWVLKLDSPYDYNNKVNGIPEEEADNLGQTLFLLSLFTDKNHPLVAKTIAEIPKFQKTRFGKRYIKGHTDFEFHAAYQTKWLKYGLGALGLEDPYEIPNHNEGYNTLFWWDYKQPELETEPVEVWRYYPYISWAKDHYFGTKNSPISNRDYPLTWEIDASQADYEKMKIIDVSYYDTNTASPHTWHAAEVFLYLLDI